jgi:nucleotide-binding universal stress UspA family protein
MQGLQESMAAHAIEYFAQYMQLARKHGANCELDLVHGACNQTVSKDICRKVEELSAAVVVLSEQKQGFIESLFMQTPVTQHVVQNCSRPTLVLNHNA